MTLNLSIPSEMTDLKPRITVVGVGGAGGNAVNNMIRASLVGCEFIACNTDAQALQHSLADCRIQLGQGLTRGLGAGSRPDVGRAAAEEAIDEIMQHLVGANMVFITAGMGGGTGTGAAPVIAKAARENGILTVGVVTKPFHFEGTNRMRLAEAGIDELHKFVDTLLIIPNQNLFRVANERTTFAEAFKMADDVLHAGVRGVTDLMMMPGLINLDFSDIRTVMSEMGKAMMGTGESTGEKRAIEAAEAAISNPLLDDVSMKGARGVLINITGGMDMTLFEVDEAANRIREEVDPEANIIFGSTFDEKLDGRIRISVVATGIDAEISRQAAVQANALMPAERPRTAGSVPTTAPSHAPSTQTPPSAVPLASLRPENEPAPLPSFARKASAGPTDPVAAPIVKPALGDRQEMDAAHHGDVRDGAFIPPRPVAPPTRSTMPPHESEPLATQIAREARAPIQRRSGGNLFQRIVDAARGRAVPPQNPAAQHQAHRQPPQPPIAAQMQPTQQIPPQVSIPPAQAATPPQAPRLGPVDQADRQQPATGEEDYLDIPAFLRRHQSH